MIPSKYLRALLCLVGALSIITLKAYSQDIPSEFYSSKGIPDSLKEDANSVIRYSSDVVTINGPGKAVIKHHSIITILNEKGDDEAIVKYYYDRKFDNYSFIDLRIYNENGTLIKKYHKSDMYDASASDNETLVTGYRSLTLRHAVASYPTTVEINYEEDLNSFINLDDWHILDGLEQSLQNAEYKVLANPEMGFRFKCKNISMNPLKGNEKGFDTYTWTVKNLKSIKEEDDMRSWSVLPRILFGTSNFNCYGAAGDISSWQNYGKWQQVLNNDMCTLSAARIQEVRKMTDTIKTDKEKARFLYNYMQRSTRYVSIQLGIGGWKPFAASFVDDKKYGDCKALSNYMRALLKAVDINSYYAVINGGTNLEPADLSFPHNYFNHVILCVPFKSDTTWLECTSNTQPFGLLGAFTENRKAMVVTEDGGKLINTPKSIAQENQFNSEVNIELKPDGGAKAKIKIWSTGEIRSFFVDKLPNYKVDKQKEFVLNNFDIKQPSAFDFNPGDDINNIKEINLNLEYDKFCDVIAGDKQFIRPRALSLWDITMPVLEKRKTDFYFKYPTQKSCVTTIDLPQGFEVEAMPANSSLKFSYGNYEINYVYNKDKNQVISTAKFILTNQVIPAAKYTEMQHYMDGIAKAQNKKLVIRRKA